MNERLKELAIEAKLINVELNSFDTTCWSVAQIRFSGLLIKECYTIMHPMIRYQVGRNLALDAIKEHFGYDFGVYDE
tara:strand:+ start:225 stop:455 length:231 start_codon:yes stop_codon:yes gene_type:complete